ncbi:MAG: hypothetical protein ACK5D5_08020, partial [Bacteroidota bacterium]
NQEVKLKKCIHKISENLTDYIEKKVKEKCFKKTGKIYFQGMKLYEQPQKYELKKFISNQILKIKVDLDWTNTNEIHNLRKNVREILDIRFFFRSIGLDSKLIGDFRRLHALLGNWHDLVMLSKYLSKQIVKEKNVVLRESLAIKLSSSIISKNQLLKLAKKQMAKINADSN